MNGKNSRRVVIIEDIDSGSIEQAIFILRNNGSPEKPEKGAIVREAERIINAYVQTLERTKVGLGRKEERSRRRNPAGGGKNSSGIIIGLSCLVLAGILALLLISSGTGI